MDLTPVTSLAKFGEIGVTILALILVGGTIYCFYKYVNSHSSHSFELLTELKEVIKNNTSVLEDVKKAILLKKK